MCGRFFIDVDPPWLVPSAFLLVECSVCMPDFVVYVDVPTVGTNADAADRSLRWSVMITTNHHQKITISIVCCLRRHGIPVVIVTVLSVASDLSSLDNNYELSISTMFSLRRQDHWLGCL
jgi:hypothetical protein